MRSRAERKQQKHSATKTNQNRASFFFGAGLSTMVESSTMVEVCDGVAPCAEGEENSLATELGESSGADMLHAGRTGFAAVERVRSVVEERKHEAAGCSCSRARWGRRARALNNCESDWRARERARVRCPGPTACASLP